MVDYVTNAISDIRNYLKNEYTKRPLLVNVNNTEDYQIIKSVFESEMPIIRLSSCRDSLEKDVWPDFEECLRKVENCKGNSMFLGISQYLKFRGEEAFENSVMALLETFNNSAKIVVLFFNSENSFSGILQSLHPQIKKQILLVRGVRQENCTIQLLNNELELKDNSKINVGIITYLKEQEDTPSEKAIVKTKYFNGSFDSALLDVRQIQDYYWLLRSLATLPEKIKDSYGDQSDWEYVCKHIGNLQFEDFLEGELGSLSNLFILFHEWEHWQENEPQKKWLHFLALKIGKIQNSYLHFTIDKTDSWASFTHNVYFSILEISITDKNFGKMYEERKKLLTLIKDDGVINDFCNMVISKEDIWIYYLTDITQQERDKVFEWLSIQPEINDKVRSVLKSIYPKLIDYLMDYDLGIKEYNSYFRSYKLQKLNNKVYDDFLDLVNENAINRNYNRLLDTRNEVYEKLDKKGSIVYFFDALGVEFLGYISKICSKLNLDIDIKISKANLPTTTFSNKDFLDDLNGNYIDIKALDEIKHEGKGSYNFERTKLPLHLSEELRVIEDTFRHIKASLSGKDVDKVIVVSDHGASRLVVLYDKKITFDVESNGTQGGRCCKYVEGMEKVKFAEEVNGQYVLASYDRFKTQGAPRVETHGGATLEELIVPIIVVTNPTGKISATPVEDNIVISHKIKAVLKIYVTKSCDNVTVKIKDKDYPAIDFDGNYFTVPIHDLNRIGDYEGEVLSSGKFIDTIHFKLIRPANNDNDLGI